MNKTALAFGLATGALILVSFFILSAVMGPAEELTYDKFKQAEAVGSVRYLILMVGVVIAMLSVRKRTTGAVSYKSAIVVGIQTALVVAILVGLMEAGFMIANPEFGDAATNVYLEGMRNQGATQAEIDKAVKQMESMSWMYTPAGMGVFYLFETALVGTVVALIAGIFVKRSG
jgi:hypothetical protein